MLVETHSQSRCFGEEKSLRATGTQIPDQPAHSLVTVLTVSWLNLQNFLGKKHPHPPCSQLCDTFLQIYWHNSVFIYSKGQSGQRVNLTTHLQPVPRLRMSLAPPVNLHDDNIR